MVFQFSSRNAAGVLRPGGTFKTITLKQIALEKVGRETLIPGNGYASDWCNKNAPGLYLFTKAKKIRSPKRHRRFFSMLKKAQENALEIYGNMSPESFRESVTIAAGYYEPFFIPVEGGGVVEMRKAKSIAFENMDDDEFKELHSAVHGVICKDYLVISGDDLNRFALEFL